VKKKEPKTQKKNSKQQKEDIEKETHAARVEKAKAKAELMIELACKQVEQQQAERAATFGRWAPVVDALESVVHATFDVAEGAVFDEPRQLAKVQRVRDVVLARLSGDGRATASLADATFAVGLLAQLVDDDFKLGIAAVPDAVAATLAAREIREVLSHAFARL
jgi:hypothetical protein